jgi:hypothetical protein
MEKDEMSLPSLSIHVPLEGTPRIQVHAEDDAAIKRLEDWLDHDPRLVVLYQLAREASANYAGKPVMDVGS